MSFFDKTKHVTYVNSSEQFLQRGSNEIFIVSLKSVHSTKMCLTVSGHTLFSYLPSHKHTECKWSYNLLADLASSLHTFYVQHLAFLSTLSHLDIFFYWFCESYGGSCSMLSLQSFKQTLTERLNHHSPRGFTGTKVWRRRSWICLRRRRRCRCVL